MKYTFEKGVEENETLFMKRRRQTRSRRILYIGFALLLAGGISGAHFVRDAKFVAAWALPAPSPSPTASPAPVETPDMSAVEETPAVAEETLEPEGFCATSIFADGTLVGVTASREAAQALLNEVTAHFELMASDVGIPYTYIENEIELRDATQEEKTLLSTYETLAELFMGEDTPLTVITTLTSESVENVSCETSTQKSKYMLKGTRRIVTMGRDGATHEVSVVRYINGNLQGEPELTTAVVAGQIDEVVLEGTKAIDANAKPGKNEGEKGPDAGELEFSHPLKDARITVNFGQLAGVMHLGLDYSVKEGEEVLAACAGIVISVMERGGYGLTLELDHGAGFVTRYAHLSSCELKLGDTVAAGDVVALAGSSGNCDGPVLHFELRADGIAYNPRFYVD